MVEDNGGRVVIRLIQNELIKMLHRQMTWILLGMLVIITIGSFVIGKINEEPVSDWRNEQAKRIERYTARLKIDELPPQMYADTKNKLQIAHYRLMKGIAPIDKNPWSNLLEYAGLIEMAIIVASILSADIVSREYTNGTIKLLLIRPHCRSKILFSKYMAVAIGSFLILMLLFGTGYSVNAILYGIGDFDRTDLFLNAAGQVTEKNVFMQVIKLYGLSFFSVLSYATFSFAISTVVRKSALAVAASLLLMIVGNSMIEATTKIVWLKYLPFANSDFSLYIFQLSPRPEMTMGFSLSVLVFYMILFVGLSWAVFTRRDIVR